MFNIKFVCHLKYSIAYTKKQQKYLHWKSFNLLLSLITLKMSRPRAKTPAALILKIQIFKFQSVYLFRLEPFSHSLSRL